MLTQLICLLALGIFAPELSAPLKRAAAPDMRLSWQFEGGVLTATARANTSGWLAVGFNHKPSLPGARLFMARVGAGVGEVEEHEVRGSRHFRRKLQTVRLLGASEQLGTTEVRFRVPLEGFQAGDSITLILAFSGSDDYQHHSRMREHQTSVL